MYVCMYHNITSPAGERSEHLLMSLCPLPSPFRLQRSVAGLSVQKDKVKSTVQLMLLIIRKYLSAGPSGFLRYADLHLAS